MNKLIINNINSSRKFIYRVSEKSYFHTLGNVFHFRSLYCCKWFIIFQLLISFLNVTANFELSSWINITDTGLCKFSVKVPDYQGDQADSGKCNLFILSVADM